MSMHHPDPYGPMPQQKQNGLAISAMVLGIIGTLFGFIPVLGLLSLPLGLTGLVLGLVTVKAMMAGRTSTGFTVTGLVTSVSAVILFFAQAVLWGSVLSEPSSSAVVSQDGRERLILPTQPQPSQAESVLPPETSQAVVPETSSQPRPERSTAGYGEGMYKVGSEIEPGTYRTAGGDRCYYSRLRDATGGIGSIIANDNLRGQGYVALQETDAYINFSGDCLWEPVDAAKLLPPAGKYASGMYKVGSEIEPGTYRTAGGDSCYYSRLKDATGEIGSIIANDVLRGQGFVTLMESDAYIKFSGTCTWTKG
ncbi:hypothetical protein HCN51_45700 [Nonomuraea sp. FMUSA5-5]|uniref:DUF4190 domain-containing protein n=1 Tax=Nonomuraea composti TaxID=2720023 RepID=A0ABX1BNB8_9ACTN|nr:hypothetical protein [Nonomuraea sp. FMUSA5-5]NJP96648.1 hypothetical protein [Nonomuraea sp. FMUSA5-5]